MKDCIFCKIINKEIPTEFVYEDSEVVAFKDIHPQGRVHLLIVPVAHVETFLDLSSKQNPQLTKMVEVVQTLIKDQNIAGSYHIKINGGSRQDVPHLHWHLIGD